MARKSFAELLRFSGITASRTAALLGLQSTDRVRALHREGKLERNEDDLYTVESVLKEIERREAESPAGVAA